jgi:uncharacterized protein
MSTMAATSPFHLAPGASIKAAIAGTGKGAFADRWKSASGSRARHRHQRPARAQPFAGHRRRGHRAGACAAEADVAATLIANAVDLPGHPAIHRRPARELSPDSDLGDRLVTVAVDPLEPAEIDAALDRRAPGAKVSSKRPDRGRHLYLGGRERICGRARPRSVPANALKEPAHA